MSEFSDDDYESNNGNHENDIMNKFEVFEPEEYSEDYEDIFNGFMPKDENYQ